MIDGTKAVGVFLGAVLGAIVITILVLPLELAARVFRKL